MKIWESIGKFYGAKDAAYAWPMALVHINIMLYSFTFWVIPCPQSHTIKPPHRKT